MRKAIAVAAALALPGCVSVPSGPPPRDYTVNVEVESNALGCGASLTYSLGGGATEQHDVILPWRREVPARTGDVLVLSAQNKCDHGTIRAAILPNGTPGTQASSSGAYKIASVSLLLP